MACRRYAGLLLMTWVAHLRCAECWSVAGPGSASFAEQTSLSATTSQPSALRGFTSQGEFGDDAVPEESYLHRCARSFLAALAMFAVIAGGVPGVARAANQSVNMYFGQGCFWHVQHDLAKTEIRVLGRQQEDVTALAGYAGGTKVGNKKEVCYHNMAMAADYGQMGHTEVVGVSVPEDKVGEFAKEYIDAAASYPFGRADPQDRGGEYRSAIGLPGGMDSPLFKQLEEVNNGRLKFMRGQGADGDTVGSKKVWIYDSDKFPFYQGEVYHQFHDDMMERYSDKYHKLKQVMLDKGTLQKVACPEFGF